MLHPLVQTELKKLHDTKVIILFRYLEWPANLEIVRKKNGEIRLFVYFRKLNKASLKYNYPLPNMDRVLQKLVGSERMSMMDSFLGYN